jgi:nucleotide-binding universal stress UspA family protein
MLPISVLELPIGRLSGRQNHRGRCQGLGKIVSVVAEAACTWGSGVKKVTTVEIARRSTIVVGIDGSANSAEALRWAVAEATRRGRTDVQAIHCWSRWTPYSPQRDSDDPVADVLSHDRDWLAGGVKLSTTVAGVAVPTCPVRIHEILMHGDPAPGLVERAVDADLLVLGSRSRADIRIHVGAVEGPTARACRLRAACQVVVVPPRSDEPVICGVKHLHTEGQARAREQSNQRPRRRR